MADVIRISDHQLFLAIKNKADQEKRGIGAQAELLLKKGLEQS